MSIKELKKLSTDDLEKGTQSSKFDAFNKLKAERVCGHKPIVVKLAAVGGWWCRLSYAAECLALLREQTSSRATLMSAADPKRT